MSGTPSLAITRASGRGVPVRGHDIDTDRIMPARFLKSVSFDGLERHVFEDDRAADPGHPFNDARYVGGSVLIVNANFGCGSSREHAPQGLHRWGIKAVVGESFSEIFRGNSTMIGLLCLTADRAQIEALQTLIEGSPKIVIDIDVLSETITAGDLRFDATMPGAVRDACVSGQWNPTVMLRDRFEEVQAVAARLPYIRGF
jgi:3-isopropylmalate/(R)-2-methylmalate dehydratase small subunit